MSSSVANSMPRSANTLSPASRSSVFVSAVRFCLIPIGIYDTCENRYRQQDTRKESIQIPIGISVGPKPSTDMRFLPLGRFSLQLSAAFPKLVAVPNTRTGLQEEPVNQPPVGTPVGSLQFDHVERDGSASSLTCAACSQAILTSYYEVNGNVTCQRCRNQILAGWNRGS